MEAIILAAGEGTRMGNETGGLPKIFLDIDGIELYCHQIACIAPYCEKITIVLGYGFESSKPSDEFDFEDIPSDTQIEFTVVNDWDIKENGYTALCALREVEDDDVLLLCGDVIFEQEVIDTLINEFRNELAPSGFSGVGVVEGIQEEMTAVRWDGNELIKEYGAIKGHQEIGVFFLNKNHLSEACKVLDDNHDHWFPVIFQEVPSKPLRVDREERYEINTPDNLVEARAKWSKSTGVALPCLTRGQPKRIE